jgi:hypothetical protein
MEPGLGELGQTPPDELNDLAKSLLVSIPKHDGKIAVEFERDGKSVDFRKGVILKGWEMVTIKDFKLTARNAERGLFAKAFLPEANEFANQSYLAIKELAALELSTPILGPINYYPDTGEGTVIMYPLGEVVEGMHYYDKLYTSEEQGKIANILNKHGLDHLPEREASLILIDGKQYLVDPHVD